MSTTRTVLVMAMMVTSSITYGQTTWYVDDANCPGPGTGTEVDPFCAIQAGIDAAAVANGDDVLVADGTYNELINFNGKAITVHSINGAAVTTIDGGAAGSVVSCSSGEGSDTVLDGFSITGGTGTDLGFLFGGGMYIVFSSPTVSNCTFSGNSADIGGGMFNDGSSPTVSNCTFSDNTSDRGGGGMSNVNGSSPTVTGCTFSVNTAGFGGAGMHNDNGSSPTVTGCTFSGNYTNSFGSGMRNDGSSPTVTNCAFSGNDAFVAGGMSNHSGSNPTVTNCTFTENTADIYGGGMFNNANSNPTVINCSFSGNITGIGGGGMCNFPNNSNPTVTNCTFSGNFAGDGGGMYNESSSPTVTNCTFSGNWANDGAGMFNVSSSSPTVTNCILWGDSSDEICDDGSTPSVTYSNVEGGYPGTGNIDADPLFIDPDGDDNILGTEDDNLRLLLGSPCIDAGDNTAVPGDITTDLDGNFRFVDDGNVPDCPQAPGTCGAAPVVDMGAYESQFTCTAESLCDDQNVYTCDSCDGGVCTHTTYGDVNGSGVVDLDDILCVIAGFGDASACPTADIAGCEANGIIDLDDILAVIGAFGGADPCCG